MQGNKTERKFVSVVAFCHLRPVQEKPLIQENACMRRPFPSEWSRVLHIAAQTTASGLEPAVQHRRLDTHCTGLLNKPNISYW